MGEPIKYVKAAPKHREASAYTIVRDGSEIGTIVRRETTKTGFSRGYCVGQVVCMGWFYTLTGKREQPERNMMGGGFRTLSAAKDALAVDLARGVTP